ncbi:MAG: hypothetical protein STSR0009_19220 [Methanoregula sp.]
MEFKIWQVEPVFRNEMGVNEIGFDLFHEPFYLTVARDKGEVEIFQRDRRRCTVTPSMVRFIGS